MKTVLDRFLEYIRVDTTSDESSSNYPSTPAQLELGKRLVLELQQLGLHDACQDEYGYVTATIPANRKGGPVLGLVFGAAEDLLSFFITGGGGYPFFPGYTLTTMLGVFLYALFFYKSKITLRNVFFAKLLTNLENVLLGALWMAILSGKAWYITASGSVIKNLVCLPFQTVLLLLLMTALRPALKKMRLVE